MARQLATVGKFAAQSPFTEHQLRWWLFNRDRNGLADAGAVVRLGRRIYIDVNRFDQWIEAQNGAPASVRDAA